jgi:hypothetical protein
LPMDDSSGGKAPARKPLFIHQPLTR